MQKDIKARSSVGMQKVIRHSVCLLANPKAGLWHLLMSP